MEIAHQHSLHRATTPHPGQKKQVHGGEQRLFTAVYSDHLCQGLGSICLNGILTRFFGIYIIYRDLFWYIKGL